MALTLNTTLTGIAFSSQVPDIEIANTAGGKVEVSLHNGVTSVLSTSHFTYNGVVTVHDLRSVIEQFMRNNALALATFKLKANDGTGAVTLATFDVVYLEQRYDDSCATFVNKNFLTTRHAKFSSPAATESLYLVLAANTTVNVTYQVTASVNGATPQSFTATETLSSNLTRELKVIQTSVLLMEGIVNNQVSGTADITVHAYKVTAGDRSFTFYIKENEPAVAAYCRNAFNVYELCQLDAVTTEKATSDRSLAVTHRKASFYDQRNEKSYEVESTGLSLAQARWLEQLFYSHEVRMAKPRTDFEYNPAQLPLVLVTDFTCEISDEDGELNTVKFTYQYEDARMYLNMG